MTEVDTPDALVGIVGLTQNIITNANLVGAEAEETQRVYANSVVDEALEAVGVDVTSPGYHNARFAAAKAVEIVLSHVISDELDQANPLRGDQ